MPFELIKLIAGLLMPVPLILALLIAGLVLLIADRFRRLVIIFLIAGTGLLLTVSTPILPELALNQLETAYPVLTDPPDADWIVVLGGGVRGANGGRDAETKGRRDEEAEKYNDGGLKGWSAVHRLSESSLYRLAEGVRLAKLLPKARLVTSGGSFSECASSARLMADVAVVLGIGPERIVKQELPVNTAGEARFMAERVRENEKVILVTSAFHMQRAVALFHRYDIDVLPAPAGHLVDPSRKQKHIGHQLPQSGYIEYAELALWEWVGLFWAWIQSFFPEGG